MTIIDEIRERAVRQPAHPAIIADDRVVSYAELVGSFDARAKQLRAEGVAPGDRCGLIAPQGADYVEAALGILAAEACFVPISEDHKGPALEEFIRRARLHHCLAGDGDGFALRTPADVQAVDGQGDAAFRALQPAYLRFTSGTTSERKGVILGHQTILERLSAANEVLSIGPEDRILWLLPMAHHFVVSILLYLRQGATIVLPASSLAATVLACAIRERVTVFYASPYHYNLLAKDRTDAALPDVRLAVSTADGLRREVADRFHERFGFSLVQALGIIEVGLPVMNVVSAVDKPTALGRVAPGYEVWLRSEDGSVLESSSAERTGEICIRGAGLFDAYLRPFVLARDLLDRESFRTGDQGFFDEAGDLHLAGRRSNRINMAGMKFFCEEVEAAIDAHPAVKMSRVFAKQHQHLGEIPVAEIVLVDPTREPTRREFVDHLKERVARYKIPREFQVIEELETTATGKVRRWLPSHPPEADDRG